MRRAAIALLVASAGTILALPFFSTAIAGSSNSTVDALIGALTAELLVLGVAIALVVEAVLLYAIVRFRNTGDPEPSRDRPRYLSAWVLAIGLILLFVGGTSLQTMIALDQQRSLAGGDSASGADDAVRVDVFAEQWSWSFEYRDANVTTRTELVVPENRTVRLRLTSRDVIHSFHVPELGLKRDTNPAQWNYLTFTPTEPGEYHLFCAEYCGRGHSLMRGTIRVVEESEFETWLDEQANDSSTTESDSSAAAGSTRGLEAPTSPDPELAGESLPDRSNPTARASEASELAIEYPVGPTSV